VRHGCSPPARRILAEDRLEKQKIVIEPEEVRAQLQRRKKISEERTTQLVWVVPKIIKRVITRPQCMKAERFSLAALLLHRKIHSTARSDNPGLRRKAGCT